MKVYGNLLYRDRIAPNYCRINEFPIMIINLTED